MEAWAAPAGLRARAAPTAILGRGAAGVHVRHRLVQLPMISL